MAEHYAILRFRKLKSAVEISRAGKHNERVVVPPNAAASRVALNRYFVARGDDVATRVNQQILSRAPAGHRRDAVLAIEVMCCVSTGWQGDVDTWTNDTLNFVSQTFGANNVVSAALHLDETTPHLHCVVVPIDSGKLRASAWIGSPAKLKGLQDQYHKAVSKHGLLRGSVGSKRKHISISDIHATSIIARATLDSAISTLPKTKVFESSDEYAKRVAVHLHETLEPLAQAAATTTLLSSERQARVAGEKAAREEREKRLLADGELERIRKSEANRLRQLDLVDVAERITGIVPKREGVSTVFESDEMKLVVTGQKFKDFKSPARGDAGAISLVRHILKCEFQEAMRWLSTEFGNSVQGELNRSLETTAASVLAKAAAQPVTLEEKLEKYAPRDDSTWPRAREYLVTQRALPADLIDRLYTKGDVWANARGGVCFAKRDNTGAICGAVVRGTTSDFKQNIGSKSSGWFAVGESETVAIVESPIDALSLHSLSGFRTISSDGQNNPEMLCEHLAAQGNVELLLAAQDSDESGEDQAQSLLEAAKSFDLPASRLECDAKDWNELLQKMKRTLAAVGAWTSRIVKTMADQLDMVQLPGDGPREKL